MSYLPYPTNISGISGLFQYADKVTCIDRTNSTAIANCAAGGGFYGIFLLIGIFFFVFMATSRYGSKQAFTSASFMMMLSSLIFMIAGLVRADIIPITIIMFVASIFFLSRE